MDLDQTHDYLSKHEQVEFIKFLGRLWTIEDMKNMRGLYEETKQFDHQSYIREHFSEFKTQVIDSSSQIKDELKMLLRINATIDTAMISASMCWALFTWSRSFLDKLKVHGYVRTIDVRNDPQYVEDYVDMMHYATVFSLYRVFNTL